MVGEIIYIAAGKEGEQMVKQLIVVQELEADYVCKDKLGGISTIMKEEIFLEQNDAENHVFAQNSLVEMTKQDHKENELVIKPVYVRNNVENLD